jgi:L-lactate dehydrogenase (cytochrome)
MPLSILNVEDARKIARRRLPKMIFDYIDGAAGTERLNTHNQQILDDCRLQPRVLVNVEQRSLHKRVLGQAFDLPFGIAPMGMCNLAWPGADKLLAEAAARHNIPVCLSTMGSTTIEDMRSYGGKNCWFQLYVGASLDEAMSLVNRAEKAGYTHLILSVDVPVVAQRLRDVRNGFKAPLKIGPRQFVDFATHPVWSISSLLNGVPTLANIEQNAPDGTAFKREAGRAATDWSVLEQLRERWPHQLIVKGVMSVDDALRVKATGADAVYVSNHGGRQLESAPTALEALIRIRKAVGDDYPVLFDSGVRSGESVVKALACGADFVFMGRPFSYAIGAGQHRGLQQLIELFERDISSVIAQIGCTDVAELGAGNLAEPLDSTLRALVS